MESYLASSGEIELEHTSDNGSDAIAAARRLQPDLLLVSSDIENVDYLEVTHQVVASQLSTKVVVISPADNNEDLIRAQATGIYSCLTEDAISVDFFAVLHLILAGNRIYTQPHGLTFSPSPGMVDYDLSSRFMSSTGPRDRLILNAMVSGSTNAQIATVLCLSVSTVKAEVARFMDLFKVRTRVQLAVLFVQAGMLGVRKSEA